MHTGMAGEVVFAERAADAVEGFERLTLGVQRFALTTPEAPGSPDRLDFVDLVGFSDRRKAQDLPRLLRENVADEVVPCSRCMMMTIAPWRLSLSRL